MSRKRNRKEDIERSLIKKQKKQQRDEQLQSVPIIFTLEGLEEAMDKAPGTTERQREASSISSSSSCASTLLYSSLVSFLPFSVNDVSTLAVLLGSLF